MTPPIIAFVPLAIPPPEDPFPPPATSWAGFVAVAQPVVAVITPDVVSVSATVWPLLTVKMVVKYVTLSVPRSAELYTVTCELPLTSAAPVRRTVCPDLLVVVRMTAEMEVP
jgi:hypothetical protein